MTRIVNAIETIGGFLLLTVALLIASSVTARYVFSFNLPDAFDISRFLQGVTLFWGLAVTTYGGSHICVDIAHEMAGRGGKRAIDIAAEAIMVASFAVFAYAMYDRLWPTINSGQTTNELMVPIWPFYLLALLGVSVTTFVALLRLVRAIKHHEPDA